MEAAKILQLIMHQIFLIMHQISSVSGLPWQHSTIGHVPSQVIKAVAITLKP